MRSAGRQHRASAYVYIYVPPALRSPSTRRTGWRIRGATGRSDSTGAGGSCRARRSRHAVPFPTDASDLLAAPCPRVPEAIGIGDVIRRLGRGEHNARLLSAGRTECVFVFSTPPCCSSSSSVSHMRIARNAAPRPVARATGLPAGISSSSAG